MVRTWSGALLAALLLAPAALAQTNTAKFTWRPGQVLDYRVEHVTTVTDVAGGSKVEMTAKLNLGKRWQVLAVDPQGVATVQVALTALRSEHTRPSGEVLLFDSANPDKSTPELREQLARYVGPALAVLRLDAQGKVVEVKESKFYPASRYESEPPFQFVLPDKAPAVGLTWERNYAITLEPPHGTGEKFDAKQKYECRGVDGGKLRIALTTTVLKLPASLLDRVPLLNQQPEGEVVFDLAAGRLQSARLRIDRTLEGHQGAGSSYRLQSTYSEEFVSKN
jgi:hypothetical protein